MDIRLGPVKCRDRIEHLTFDLPVTTLNLWTCRQNDGVFDRSSYAPEGAREPRVYPGKHLNLECALKVVLEFSHVIERFF